MNTPNTVETLELLLKVAEQLGYSVRYECLGGSSGGSCEIGGKKVMFVDLSLNPIEQLDQVRLALKQDSAIYVAQLPKPVEEILGVRKAA